MSDQMARPGRIEVKLNENVTLRRTSETDIIETDIHEGISYSAMKVEDDYNTQGR